MMANNNTTRATILLLLLTAAIPTPATATTCTDTPNWSDFLGDNCGYYNSPATCSSEGIEGDGGMGVAIDNCCSCGGGTVTVVVATTTITTTTEATAAAVVAATTAKATEAAIVNPGGTCGKGGGDRGNGVCVDGRCCSKHGWCGITPAHCDGLTFAPTISPITPTASPTTTSPTKKTTTQPTTLKPTPTPTKFVAEPTSPKPTPPPITSPPTTTPTSKDWAALTPNHISFCGPKVVGGYAVAIEQCSFQTECDKEESANTAYGATGNDCPKGGMCYTDILCAKPSDEPSGGAERDSLDERNAHRTSERVGERGAERERGADGDGDDEASDGGADGSKAADGLSDAVSDGGADDAKGADRAANNLQNSIETRGSYCGISFELAVDSCSPGSSCSSNDDCGKGECFINISCMYHASEASDHSLVKDPVGKAYNMDGEELKIGVEESDDGGGIDRDGLSFVKDGSNEDSSAVKGLFRWVGTMAVVVVGALLLV
eukprot:CAMPEP_0201866942 /NCGR_PEP_ID=MMETSP0902-20130614/1352_1 /ASSEMBLY_ACC=CAM_ASM_000551 /TAXON_ID=420261 /ORGANISM="Thalassiosira antarctica, Strain CCMP982" /LENGTH=490 /DNA_ID=CAMNT_0048392009 /DNA_START=46 /DNA_END=1518 /DNA_ORIENTATION=-